MNKTPSQWADSVYIETGYCRNASHDAGRYVGYQEPLEELVGQQGRVTIIETIQAAMAQAVEEFREKASTVNLDNTGREWVKDSLWDAMAKQFSAAIRALPNPYQSKGG